MDPAGVTVSGPVVPGQPVTVLNPGAGALSVTAVDGSFDAPVPPGSFITFPAPEGPGEYPFFSRGAEQLRGTLVVQQP